MKKEITIKDVKLFKEGVGRNNKRYRLFDVTDSEGGRYRAFDSVVGRLQIGGTYNAEVAVETVQKDGRTYKNMTIQSVASGAATPAVNEQYVTQDQFEALEQRVASLEEELLKPKNEAPF